MPSAKILSEKQAYVADLKAKFESAVSGCVVAYGGINVENDTKLRKELREAGVDYMVVKNTMLRLAVKGTSLEALAEQFKGDTAIAFAHEEDPMSASWTARSWTLPRPTLSQSCPTAKACCPCLQAPSPALCLVWLLQCRLMPTSRRSPLPDGRVTAA